MSIKEELDRELAEFRLNPDVDPNIPDTELFLIITNNFHIRIPGGDFYREYRENKLVERNLDEKLGDWARREVPVDRVEYFLTTKSKKYWSKTLREIREDVTHALRLGGMSEELLAELSRVREKNGTNQILNRDREASIPLLYRAYRILREEGYARGDLI